MLNGYHGVHAIDLGMRLGLFQDLSNATAAGSVAFPEFVGKTTYPDRYISAWLHAIQAVDIIHINQNGMISFQGDWQRALTDDTSDEYIGSLPECYLRVGEIGYPHFMNLFKSGKTSDWRRFGDHALNGVSADGRRFANFFIDTALKKMPDLEHRLANGGVIYDIGCGAGNFSLRLAEHFKSTMIIGFDPCNDAIQLANEKKASLGLGDNIQFKVSCATRVPASGADIVILNEVLHEMPSDIRFSALQAIQTALKKNGALFITDPVLPNSYSGWHTEDARYLALMIFSEAPLVPDAPLSSDELSQMLYNAGFKIRIDVDSSNTFLAAFFQ